MSSTTLPSTRCSRTSTLDGRTRLMVHLAAVIASQALREYAVMLGAALNVGVTPVEAKAIVYQAVLT
jgi:4-carboxymuconolactone decarboxylase